MTLLLKDEASPGKVGAVRAMRAQRAAPGFSHCQWNGIGPSVN